MLKHEAGRQGLIDALREQKGKCLKRRSTLLREIDARQAEIDRIDERLRAIEHSEGLLR